jgi:hypothetical protein
MDIKTVKKVRLLANYILLTFEKYTKDDQDKEMKEGKIISHGIDTLKEFQRVVAVGPVVRGISENDIVKVNPKRYAVMKHQEGSLKDNVITDNPVLTYNFPVVEINGVPYMKLTDSDIDYVVEEYDSGSDIIQSPTIITKPDLIV